MAVSSFVQKTKDPSDRLDYEITWQNFLTDGDVITESTWATYTDTWAPTEEMAVDEDAHTDTTATAWVVGGVAGTSYFATNHITTAAGREKDLSIQIVCKEQ